jgi:hypothetical protein
MKRIIPVIILSSVLLQGCAIYSYYSNEKFESKEPSSVMELRMKDHIVHRIQKKDILMMKYSPDSYTIYFKTGPVLRLKKDEISKIRMVDNGKVTFEVTLILATVTALMFLILYFAIGVA